MEVPMHQAGELKKLLTDRRIQDGPETRVVFLHFDLAVLALGKASSKAISGVPVSLSLSLSALDMVQDISCKVG